MRLEQLEYLLEISRTHSISSASKNLHISQQSLSKAILNLEQELSAELLDRTTQGVFLTTQGKIVLENAQNIFAELATMKSNLNPPLAQTNNALHGQLRIIYSSTFDYDQLTTSINAFTTAYPQVKVSAHQKSTIKLIEAICANEADICFLSLPGTQALSDFIHLDALKDLSIISLFSERLLVAVSKNSPLADHRSVAIATLLKYPLSILQTEENSDLKRNWISKILQAYGTPHFVLATNDPNLYFKSISENTCIGLCTKLSKQLIPAFLLCELRLIPIRPSIYLYYSYVINHNCPLSPVAEAYLPFLPKASPKEV